MKKIYLFLLAAASVFAVASCQQAEMEEPMPVNPEEVTTLTLAFDATRTALVDGKTAWVAGDKVRIYNSTGTFYDDITISEADAGKSSIEIEVNMKDKEYFAVYPVEAANGVSSGNPSIRIPSNPDGLFSSANICVAKTGEGGTTLRMRNATAILKLKVASGNVVEILQFNAQNPMTGTYTVDLSGEAPVLTAVSGSKAATVAVGGVDGDYFIPVAPGTYAEEFAVTALRGNGGYQTLTSTKANEIAMNTIVDMGSIGDNLSTGLTGEGTEASPYMISNLGEWGAFTASVNLGNPYTGKFVSLGTDVEDVRTPIGYYLAADDQAAFAGNFLGNNHTVTVDLEGINCKAQTYVALFGVVDEGATVKDLKVKGTAKASGNYTCGLVSYCRGSSDNRVTINNITSDVVVESQGDRVSGIAGYAEYTDFDNCTNNGAVQGNNSVAGIVAYSYYSTIKNCQNAGSIKATADAATSMFLSAYNYFATTAFSSNNNWTYGVGGIAGFAQNSTVSDVSNSASITAFMKVGGIVGTGFWTNISSAKNYGEVEGTGSLNCRADSQMGQQWGSVTGGITGYLHGAGVIESCENNGAVKGHGGLGGIVGNVDCYNNDYSKPTVKNCVNNASVESTEAYQGGTSAAANPGTGGIVGNLVPYGQKINNVWRCFNPTVEDCTNKGPVKSVRSDGQANFVGGIVGSSYFPGAVTNRGQSVIDRCVNEGSVTGGYWVGGILGGAASRYCGLPTLKNCANHGTVLAEGYSTKYKAILAGGLVGGAIAYNTGNRNNNQMVIYNCYNDGEVLYSKEDITTPYIGGLIGSTWGGAICQNVYNAGYVGPASKGAPAEGAINCLGALVGYQHASIVHFAYYPKGMLNDQPVGKNSAQAARTDTVCSFDENGDLSQPVTANNIDCTTLLQVLNEYVNYYPNSGYTKWTGSAGKPVFVNPD